MDYDKFKGELRRAKVSVKAFAELLQMNPTSITNYHANNQVPLHLGLVAHMLAELTSRGYGIDTIAAAIRKPDHS